MGEVQGTLFRPVFNRSIQVETRPERLTADAGAILLRELLDRSGLSRLLSEHLTDPRHPQRITHPFLELLRTWLVLDSQGWNDQEDVTALRHDPALRLAVSRRRGDGPLRSGGAGDPDGLCSQPTLSRLLHALSAEPNRQGLGRILLAWATRQLVRGGRRLLELVVDLDSIGFEVHGHQPGSEYNGHFRMRCFHPVVARLDGGLFLGARLRRGRAHTADGGLDFVLPILRWLARWAQRVWLRIDAGFPEPTLLSTLEAEGFYYVARLRSNAALERLAAPYLRRPAGRPPAEGRLWLHELAYRAGTWERPRRVVLVVLERPDEQQHLFLDHFFLLTNAPAKEVDAAQLLARYRRRGEAEKDFGDWKSALDLSLSSTQRPKSHYRERPVRTLLPATDSFAANEARLLLSLLSANLLALGATVLAGARHTRLSRESFRQHLLKATGRVLLSGRAVTLVIGARHAGLWRAFCRRLERTYPARGSPHAQALPTPA